MLLFIVGLAITALGVIFLLNTFNMLFMLVFAVGLLVTVISAFQPLSGWGTPKTISEYELLPLIPGSNCYICEDKYGRVMFRYNLNGKEVIESKDKTHVMYEEIEENEVPVMKKSIVNPKRTLWAFPILSSKDISVLYVPKDSIVR